MVDRKALDYLHEERFELFNTMVKNADGYVDLSGAHLRGLDLRKCHLVRADLTGAYLRFADLRGLDLSESKLDGASLKEAKVSGVLFPRSLSPTEIMMSLQHGTRLRQNM